MTMSQAGASSIPNCATTSSPFDNRTIPAFGGDGADFNLRSYSACHGKHAESCKIDRFNTVVDEYSEQHVEPILLQPIRASSFVSRAASAAHNVISAIPIIMTETPAVPPKYPTSAVAMIGGSRRQYAAATWNPNEAPL